MQYITSLTVLPYIAISYRNPSILIQNDMLKHAYLTLSPLNPIKPCLPAHPCKNKKALSFFYCMHAAIGNNWQACCLASSTV